jgi:transcriptional regulator with XRE-family HTH domain
MTDTKQRLAEALVQAALEGDDSPKVMVSMRVLEIIASDAPRRVEVAPMAVRGEELRAALAINGRSQTELARRLGVHVSAINKICSGVRDVSASEAEAITAYLAETEQANVGDIRLARESLGWSQARLAELVGTTQQTVDRIEKGETTFSRYVEPIRRCLAEAVG